MVGFPGKKCQEKRPAPGAQAFKGKRTGMGFILVFSSLFPGCIWQSARFYIGSIFAIVHAGAINFCCRTIGVTVGGAGTAGTKRGF